jgi:ParB family chromosome partitioning protein
MNAVTQTEARAIEAAAPLEAADPTKNLILVPLSRLVSRPRAATCARPRACPSPNWPRASSASACCKT